MQISSSIRNLSYRTILLLTALILLPTIAFADILTVSTDKTTYAPGQSMKITAVFKQDNGTPITSPKTREVRIENPSGMQVAKTRMTNVGSGVYTYTYKLPTTARIGKWEVRAKFEYDGNGFDGNEIKAYTYPTVASSTADTTPPVTSASPAGGTYTSAQTVTLSRNETGTTYYTTNGTTPTTASAVYSAPISISTTTTLKYFSRDAAGNNEAVKTQIYTISTPPPADTTPPVTSASPTGGSYTAAQTVTLSANETATTYYTLNGTTPTTASAVYSAPIAISATTTLKYFSRDTAGNSEAVKTQTYTITIPPPADITPPVTSASPAGGSYTSAQTVTLTRNETGTTYYTTNGATPTTASAVYSAPIAISATTTLKYFSRDTAGNSEAVKTETYTITTPPTATDHSNLTWTGYGTCTTCHSDQAQAMYQSVHYQWKGSAAEMTTGPTVQGKMDAIDGSSALNAYCINIQGNWGPCGSCHVGTGAKPVATATPSAAQLAAIDCLICHNSSAAPYSRVRNATTGLFEPAAGLDMTQVARNANVMPERKNCLGCHAKAGGGDAVKRGDIAIASGTTADDLYDVHMATDRGNLSCQSCHTMTNHRVAGRGSDLRPEDTTAEVSCSTSSCHSGKTNISSGHSSYDISHHVGRVACQTCHIPKYAKNANDTAATEATETHRTWEHAEWNAALNRYEPLPTKANDLKPRYSFWDGTSWGNNAFDAAVIDPVTGNYKISRPNGAINTANTKLYPFKYKTATQAVANGKLITLSTATFFGTGNYDQAVKDGLTYMGLPSTTPYTTVTTDELQVLNHQVPPATGNALACAACHPNATATQMKLVTDFGYGTVKPQSDLCNDCHSSKSWPGYASFHKKHVQDKKYDCQRCHSFSRKAERGLN